MLAKSIINDVLFEAVSTGGDFAEIFVENKLTSSISQVGGKLDSAMSGRDFGIGIRIFKGTNSIYAYTNSSDKEDIVKTAKKAAAAVTGEKKDIDFVLDCTVSDNIHKVIKDVSDINKKEKMELVKRAYNCAKNFDGLIKQVTVGYGDSKQDIMIANTEGLCIRDQRIRTRIAIRAIAEKDGEMQTGFFAPGALKGYELYDEIDVKWYAKEAARSAAAMVNAKYCPGGKMPVIIDSGFGGVIFHEACGHGLEATSVAKGTSVFCNKKGEKIASDIITAVDDGTIPNEWGSINIDDEGNKSRKNILIENGILKGYMVDRLNGRRMDCEATGSGRRQSYRYAPTSRMTNTYIANGNSTLKEIIEDTEYGLYAKYMGGGSVNPATGEFNFAVNEGYLIKNGKIDKPVRGATLIGTGTDILNKIDMVADNLSFGQGMCGSLSGSIPTNVGQPAIRVSEITVGGR